MYNSASFREMRLEVMQQLIRERPLGMLVSAGERGLLASPLPFLLVPEQGEFGVLRAHLARANPHWREFVDGGECMVIFQGEQGYVTPDWYPSKVATHKVVPTWNYAIVQVRGRVSVHGGSEWLHQQLGALTHEHEQCRARPWSLAEAPEDYLAAQMQAIVGLEIAITQIDGKWKMSQNRDVADQQGVVDGLRDASDPHAQPAMAEIVEQRMASAKPT